MAMQSSLDPKHIKDFESIYIEISRSDVESAERS